MGEVRNARCEPRSDIVRLDAIGFDAYNQTLIGGGVSMTLTAKTTDAHHVPCVLIYEKNDEHLLQKDIASFS